MQDSHLLKCPGIVACTRRIRLPVHQQPSKNWPFSHLRCLGLLPTIPRCVFLPRRRSLQLCISCRWTYFFGVLNVFDSYSGLLRKGSCRIRTCFPIIPSTGKNQNHQLILVDASMAYRLLTYVLSLRVTVHAADPGPLCQSGLGHASRVAKDSIGIGR